MSLAQAGEDVLPVHTIRQAHSRSTLDLSGVQNELVESVQATGTPVIIVLMTGRPLAIERLRTNTVRAR